MSRRKVIAIGSRIMGDDAIGVQVAEILQSRLEAEGVQVVIGETDLDYVLSEIETGDFLVVLDAAALGGRPGSVHVLPFGWEERNLVHGCDGGEVGNRVSVQEGYEVPKWARAQDECELVKADLGAEYETSPVGFSQHGLNLPHMFFAPFVPAGVRGYLLGIEVAEIQPGLELSTALQARLNAICCKVDWWIKYLMKCVKSGEVNMAKEV